jgi:hypothetical protein
LFYKLRFFLGKRTDLALYNADPAFAAFALPITLRIDINARFPRGFEKGLSFLYGKLFKGWCKNDPVFLHWWGPLCFH